MYHFWISFEFFRSNFIFFFENVRTGKYFFFKFCNFVIEFERFDVQNFKSVWWASLSCLSSFSLRSPYGRGKNLLDTGLTSTVQMHLF